MKVQMVSINEIELDLSNPRIARMLSMHKKESITSELIALALGAGDSQEGDTYATYRNLKESIKTNGGVIYPIIVNKVPNGKMTVVEGNTRLQIYKEFLQEKAKGDWSKIPAIIHDSLSQMNIDAIRLQAHLVGPRPWDPY
jgi:ParB-like chromosome segregation protein Spo0J